MGKCYFSRKHRIGRNLCLFTVPILALVFLAVGVVLLWGDNIGGPANGRILLGTGILVFDVLFIVYESLYLIWLDREFTITKDGIRIFYSLGRERIIQWSDVSHVCVWETHHGADKADSVIWCSIGTQKHRPPSMPFFADGFEYEFLHSQSVLALEYSRERLEIFKQYYHQEIPDLRSVTLKEL